MSLLEAEVAEIRTGRLLEAVAQTQIAQLLRQMIKQEKICSKMHVHSFPIHFSTFEIIYECALLKTDVLEMCLSK